MSNSNARCQVVYLPICLPTHSQRCSTGSTSYQGRTLRIRHREPKTMNNTTSAPERLSCIRFVRLAWLWLRPCAKAGHSWRDWCHSCAPAGRSVVTGRRCRKCLEIQTIDEDSMTWETRATCEECKDYCAIDGSSRCAQCQPNKEAHQPSSSEV
jgi:hypothetical protein